MATVAYTPLQTCSSSTYLVSNTILKILQEQYVYINLESKENKAMEIGALLLILISAFQQC